MVVISAYNIKGGCGKTSSVISLGAQMAMNGYRVLLIDGDESCNLSSFFCDSLGVHELLPTLKDYFEGNADSDELIHHFRFERYPGDRFITTMQCVAEPRNIIRRFTIVSMVDPDDPDNPDLDYIDIEPEEFSKLKLSRSCELSFIPYGVLDADHRINIKDNEEDRTFLRDLLKEYTDSYDIVLIDCPPETMPISVPILYASDYALIPTEAANDSIRGIGSLLQTIQDTPNVMPLGIYFTKVNTQESVAKKLSKRLRKGLGPELVFDTSIRQNTMQEKSRDAAVPLCILRPASPLAGDYRSLTDEILTKLHMEKEGEKNGKKSSAKKQ